MGSVYEQGRRRKPRRPGQVGAVVVHTSAGRDGWPDPVEPADPIEEAGCARLVAQVVVFGLLTVGAITVAVVAWQGIRRVLS